MGMNGTQMKSDDKEHPVADPPGVAAVDRIVLFSQHAVTALLGIFIFFTPIPHTTAIKEICFYSALVITLVLVLSGKMRWSFRSPLAVPFALYAIWAFIGLFFALDKANSIHDFYAHLIKYLILYYLLIHFYNTRGRLVGLSWIIVLSITSFSVLGATYYYGIKGFHLMEDRIDFLEMEINIIGFPTLFGILLALTLYGWQKRNVLKALLLISIAGIGFVTLLTRSLGTLLGLIFSLATLFPRRKLIVSAIGCLMALLILILPVKARLTPDAVYNKLRTEDRVNIWSTYYELFKDYPIMGIGFGQAMWQDKALWDRYASRLPANMQTINQDPGNILVSNLVRLGVVGLGLYLYILFAIGKMGWALIRRGRDDFIKDFSLCTTAAFIAYFVKGMFEPGLAHVPALVAFTILAMMTSLWRMQGESPVPDGAKVTRETA
jgi:O-antigen ligase